MRRLSVRQRLTLTYAGLFLLMGGTLLTLNYTLMSEVVPGPTGIAIGAPGSSTGISDVSGQQFQVIAKDIRDATLKQLLVQSTVALAIMALVSAILGWFIAGRIVKPLSDMTATARRLSEHNLKERFRLRGPDDELKDLANTFDAMLSRLDGAFESQRNFVANASHELRTPLAITRAAVETQLERRKPTAEQWHDMAERVLASTERSERLITSLLLLARVEHGTQVHQDIDLASVVSEALEEARPAAAREGITLDPRVEPAPVAGDPQLLRRMAANLIDNAIRYNRPSGFVITSVTRAGDRARLAVMNSCTPLSREVLAEIFEPFRRGTDPRTRSTKGSGLGLSIVKSIVIAHGGTVGAESMDRAGIQVTVELPLRASQ